MPSTLKMEARTVSWAQDWEPPLYVFYRLVLARLLRIDYSDRPVREAVAEIQVRNYGNWNQSSINESDEQWSLGLGYILKLDQKGLSDQLYMQCEGKRVIKDDSKSLGWNHLEEWRCCQLTSWRQGVCIWKSGVPFQMCCISGDHETCKWRHCQAAGEGRLEFEGLWAGPWGVLNLQSKGRNGKDETREVGGKPTSVWQAKQRSGSQPEAR